MRNISGTFVAVKRPPGGLPICPGPLGVDVGLTLATSNAGFCAGVCDAAGITAIADMSTKATGFMNFSPANLRYQCDSEVRVRESKIRAYLAGSAMAYIKSR
jgi:hypothetical protein